MVFSPKNESLLSTGELCNSHGMIELQFNTVPALVTSLAGHKAQKWPKCHIKNPKLASRSGES